MRHVALVGALLLAVTAWGDYRTYPPDTGDGAPGRGKGKGRPIGVTPGPPPPGCKKCWDYDRILEARNICNYPLGAGFFTTCSLTPPEGAGASNYLLMSCDPGGGPPPTVLGIYIQDGADCSANDLVGPDTSNDSLNAKQQQECKDSIIFTGWCL